MLTFNMVSLCQDLGKRDVMQYHKRLNIIWWTFILSLVSTLSFLQLYYPVLPICHNIIILGYTCNIQLAWFIAPCYFVGCTLWTYICVWVIISWIFAMFESCNKVLGLSHLFSNALFTNFHGKLQIYRGKQFAKWPLCSSPITLDISTGCLFQWRYMLENL